MSASRDDRDAARGRRATAAVTFSQRWIDRAQRRRVFRDVFEIALVALAFLLYFIVRGSVVDRHDDAFRHAQDVIDLERSLGVYWEPRLQELVIGRRLLIELMNFIYFWLDFPLIVGIGLWLYVARRHEYTVARDALLLSGAISLVIYNLYPVMPPRLLPGGEFVGTVEEFSSFSYQAQSMQAFVNPYAAIPSLHFGWAMIIGGAVFWTARHPVSRGLGLLLPWAQLAAIVFTANHYIADAFVGLVVCLAGVVLALALQRWGYPWLRQRVDAMAMEAPSPAPA